MTIKVKLDMKECCRMAGVPFKQEYLHEIYEDTDDRNFILVSREGDTFSIDSHFPDGWLTDALPILSIFQRLRNDLIKIHTASKQYANMKLASGDGEITCTQSGVTFECGAQYVASLSRRWNSRQNKMLVMAKVKNSVTGAETEHEVGTELSEDAAKTAIRLHIAEVNLEGAK